MDSGDTLRLREAICKSLGFFLDEIEREGDVHGSHTPLMLELGSRIGKKIKLAEGELQTLENCIRISHSLKVGLPMEIATTRGGLTEITRRVVAETVQRNLAQLREISVLAAEVKILEGMYEWFDGSGLTSGRDGEGIPILSRILCLVRAYTVLREGSPYTSLHSREEAWEEVASEAGSHFDPRLVDSLEIVLAEYYADGHDQSEGHILIVEDDPCICGILERRLGWSGYEVVCCHTEAAALQHLRERRWQALILDVMLPSLNGLVFCQRLRQEPAYQTLPIVINTCRSDREAIQSALDAGASAFALKPMAFEPLLVFLAQNKTHTPDAPLVFIGDFPHPALQRA